VVGEVKLLGEAEAVLRQKQGDAGAEDREDADDGDHELPVVHVLPHQAAQLFQRRFRALRAPVHLLLEVLASDLGQSLAPKHQVQRAKAEDNHAAH